MKRGLIQNLFRLLMTTATERAYFDACEDRTALSDADFHRKFYADSNVTQATCAGVRRVLCEQLRMCNTLPEDDVEAVFPEVDIAELCYEIEEEFDIKFPDQVFGEIGGTVDSLIRATQRLIQ